jgi:hypothetical protein
MVSTLYRLGTNSIENAVSSNSSIVAGLRAVQIYLFSAYQAISALNIDLVTILNVNLRILYNETLILR